MQPKSVEKNFLYSAIANGSDAMVFVLGIAAGRILGTTDFGVFSFAQALAAVVMSFTNLGLPLLAVRDVSRERALASRYLGNILSWKGILSSIVYLGLLTVVLFLMETSKEEQLSVSLLAIAVCVRYFSITVAVFLRAFDRFELEALAVFIEQVVLLVLGMGALFLGYGLLGLVSAYCIARIFGFSLTFFLVKKVVDVSFLFEPKFIYTMQLRALPIGIGMLASTAQMQVDALVLSAMRQMSEVGLYSAAFKIYAGLSIFPSIVCSTLLPRLSSAYHKDKALHARLFKKGAGYLLGASLALATVGGVWANDIVRTIFGEAFSGAAIPMQILLAATVVTFQIWFLRIYLISINRQNLFMAWTLIGVAVRVGLHMYMIPPYGIVGAALATTLSELFVFGGIWICLLRSSAAVQDRGTLTKHVAKTVQLFVSRAPARK